MTSVSGRMLSSSSSEGTSLNVVLLVFISITSIFTTLHQAVRYQFSVRLTQTKGMADVIKNSSFKQTPLAFPVIMCILNLNYFFSLEWLHMQDTWVLMLQGVSLLEGILNIFDLNARLLAMIYINNS